MKIKLLLSVGLLTASFVAPLRAQAWFETKTAIQASPADGTWWVTASVELKDDWNGDWSMADMTIQSLVYENGYQVANPTQEGGPPMVSLGWTSPNQVQLNANYDITSYFGWQNPPDPMTGDPGPSGGNALTASISTPPPPSIGLLSIDATSPNAVQIT
jgi:hypothetical protein